MTGSELDRRAELFEAQRRFVASMDARDGSLPAVPRLRRLIWRDRARTVARFVAVVWMLLCVTATAWFVGGIWRGHYALNLTVPFCVQPPEPTI